MKKKIIIIIAIFITLIVLVIISIYALKNIKRENLLKNKADYDQLRENKTIPLETEVTENILRSEISIESIFNYDEPTPEKVKGENNTYTLLATGDVIAGRSVNYKTTKTNNFNLPYEKTADFLRSADITFVNFESPLVKDCPVTVDGMIFCGDERNIEGLIYSGIDIVNFANNHMGNYGKEGIDNTVRVFDENDISYTGLGGPTILEVKGKKFGFLGYNDVADAGPHVSSADNEKIIKEITDLKDKVDFVIVAFHWGEEYTSDPTERQIEFAHLSIDSGADLIVGNHAHWVQAVEIYNGKFISYAHGNFVFDQMWSQETREGVLGKYVFDDVGLVEVQYYPIVIEDYNQPRFASKNEAEKILSKMMEASLNLRD